MSFIDDSGYNVKKYNSSFKEEKKSLPLLKEVTGGSVGGFVGGKGMGIDALFAGPYHPDSGHGSENEKLLKKQLKDRKEKRKDIESSRDGVIDDYSGLPDPVGGYYETDTEFAELAYEELETRNQTVIDYSIENTPLQDTEWVEVETNLEYDEPGEAYKIKDIVYDDKSTYAGENFINQSQTNWEIIDRG